MTNLGSKFLGPVALIVGCGLVGALAVPTFAQKVQLKDGRILRGRMLNVIGVAKTPLPAARAEDAENESTPILLVDDELRRVYVSKYFLVDVLDDGLETFEKFKPWQNISQSGSGVGSVGPSLGISPFDEYGRRIYRMQTRDGPLAIVQGITELTPHYAKVESWRGQPRWDMRLGISSIPRDTLKRILAEIVSHEDPNDWLRVVRFYLQAERYRDARLELEAIIQRFPDLKTLETEASRLKRLSADRVLKEIKLRRSAGQHELVTRLLDNFPPEEVEGETLQQVREMIAAYADTANRIEAVKQLLAQFTTEVSDADHRQLIEPLVQEIAAELSPNVLQRLVPFAQLADDPSLTADEKIALATTGWVLGESCATQKISVAISLLQIRAKVLQYLREPMAHKRIEILDSIRSAEGASVENLARLIANMRPPWEIPAEAELGYGAYELTAPGQSENGDFPYLVQLPPEYDPHKRYPTIIALNGAYNSPVQELEFWTGPHPKDEGGNIAGPRRGQAMRHGYITIAVEWQKKQQYAYEYSLREHEAVLTTLRDAMRRFSVDADRVYLTGHGIGGDAAWDFGLSHPDLWAGVLPFVARHSELKKYVRFYWENAAHIPMYFVLGELDGKSMLRNAPVLDKYFIKRFDTTVVEYQGRGHEPFNDEILEAFAWMELPTHRRQASPEEFDCRTMRPWDNFFWWIEGRDFPVEVHPAQWPARSARPNQVYGKIPKANELIARTSAEQVTFWLSPDVVDFSKRIRITLNGRKLTKYSGSDQPDVEVLLEDVRTRGDRLRPFWAKLQVP